MAPRYLPKMIHIIKHKLQNEIALRYAKSDDNPINTSKVTSHKAKWPGVMYNKIMFIRTRSLSNGF